MLGLLGWTAVVVGLIWEGTHPLYQGEFDKIAIALTVMSFFEMYVFHCESLTKRADLNLQWILLFVVGNVEHNSCTPVLCECKEDP